MRPSSAVDHTVQAAGTGVAVSHDRTRTAGARVPAGRERPARALGLAVAPRTETLVLARGTHRTRVSEMRIAGARAATPRPDVPDADQRARHAAAERDRRGWVRHGTG